MRRDVIKGQPLRLKNEWKLIRQLLILILIAKNFECDHFLYFSKPV